MRHAALFAIAALATLAACDKPVAAQKAPAPKADAGVPFKFEQKSADAEVGLTLAQTIGEWPVLHRKLYTEGVAELRKFASEAPDLRADSVTPDYTPPPFARDLTWAVAAANPRVVSLRQTWYEFTGGAHPNHGYQGFLWDPVNEVEIKKAELFLAAGPADAAVDKALCDGIKAARNDKGVEFSTEDEATWPCPKWRDADFELTPSSAPGKFGGVTFLFDPYAIGSYAEGEYEVTIPQSALRGVLAAPYAPEFAGEPKVTPAKGD